MTKHSEFIDYHRQQMKSNIAISTEGFGSAMRAFFPGIFSQLGKVFEESTPSADAVQFPRDQRDFLKLIEERNYARLSQLPVFIPEGMTATYAETSKALLEAAMHTKTALPTLLSHYGQYIAVLVNTPSMWKSTKDDNTYYNTLKKEREVVSKAMDACYDNAKHETNAKYEDVIARNPDWMDVLNQTRALTDALNSIDRKQLDKSIANIMELVEVIRKRAQTQDILSDDVSRQTLTALSEGIYQIAVELEFFSVVYYRSQAFSKAVSDSMSQLTESLKYAN